MGFRDYCIFAAVIVFGWLSGCNSPYHRDQGALVGGLTGAGVGAAIGEHNDNPIAGALIGGAVGTLAGQAIGSNMDAQVAHNNAIIEQRMGRRLAGAVTAAQVISMTQAQLSDEVIVTHIRANGLAQRLTPDDLIILSRQGVSDAVLNAMQNQPPVTNTYPPPSARPVVIREQHYYGRPHCYSPHGHYHHRPAPRKSGFHFHF